MAIEKKLIREWLWEWDPLGPEDPFDPHLGRGEYDWLISPLKRELEEAKAAREIAAFLGEAVRRRYGFRVDVDVLVPRVQVLVDRARSTR